MTKYLTVVALAVALVAASCSDADEPAGSTTAPDAAGETSQDAPAAEPIEQMRMVYPQTLAFSAPFTFIDDSEDLAEVTESVSKENWTTPDVLRSLLVNGEAEVAAVPTNVAANMFNKDVDVRMVAVVVWGLLWLIGPEGQQGDWEALRGQTVMVPFKNDMPDLIFQYLARANGLTPGEDFEIQHFTQPPDVVAPLIQGTGKWAVLPEHVATIALAQANKNGRGLDRALDLQQEWAEATDSESLIPQAGVVMPGTLVDERPDVVAAFLDALERSVAQVNEASDATVAALAEESGLEPAMVSDLIPRLNLDVVPGADARESLERFFTELAETSPDLIGGKLPAEAFYVDDPR